MRIEVNISDYATEVVLSMECEDGRQRPVTYVFKLLNETECNYEIHDMEMLAVIRGLAQRHLLEGAKFKFEFTLKHVLGVRMGKADILSRRLNLKMRVRKQ